MPLYDLHGSKGWISIKRSHKVKIKTFRSFYSYENKKKQGTVNNS